jgi:hypothetical protein
MQQWRLRGETRQAASLLQLWIEGRSNTELTDGPFI